MNAIIPEPDRVSISEGDAENIETALEKAADCIVDMHMRLDRVFRDADEAMDALHWLLIAKSHVRDAKKVEAVR